MIQRSIAAFVAAGVLGTAGVAWALRRPSEGEPSPPLRSPLPPTGPSGIQSSDANEVEALARIIFSEAGSTSSEVQRAIGWVARNHFRGKKVKSIYEVQYPWRAQSGSNPPFSSARPATDATRSLAREILAADQSQDPTGGATAFFEPRMQDAFAKAGALARAGETGERVIDGVKISDITRFKGYKKDAATIRTSWSGGSRLYATAGPFELWGSSKAFSAGDGKVRMIAGMLGLDIFAVRGEQTAMHGLDVFCGDAT